MRFCVAAQCAAYRVFLRKTRAVSAKNTKIRAYSVHFQPSKVLSRLAFRIFSLQKQFHALLCAFLGFKSTLSQRDALLTDFLFARNARIFVSQGRALLNEFSCGKLAQFRQRTQKFALILCIFSVQKCFRALFCAFLGFKSAFATSPKRFQRSKALSRLALRVFSLQKCCVVSSPIGLRSEIQARGEVPSLLR